VSLFLHAAGSGVALVLTPIQASRSIRRRWPVAHRVSGRVSAVAIVIGGLSGLALAPVNYAGLSGTIGFGLLAVIWLFCLYRSITEARARRFADHRRWSLRVMALTFAAVTLRLWLALYIIGASVIAGTEVDVAFDQIYVWLPFLSWIPNLLAMEWFLSRRPSRAAPQPAPA
jgi:uncharacterized membrane protein